MEPMVSPKVVRLTVGLVCAAIALSGVALAGAAVGAGPRVNWVLLGFETVIVVAGVIGLLFARGKFQDAPGLALACVAGAVFVSAVLGYFGSDQRLVTHTGELPLKWFMVSRVLAGVAIGLLGAVLVLLRNRRSLVYLAKSAATGVPVLAVLAAYVVSPGSVMGALSALPGWAKMAALGLAGVLGVVLISASIHLLIRAFEEGKTEQA
jgi:hypothetical protein